MDDVRPLISQFDHNQLHNMLSSAGLLHQPLHPKVLGSMAGLTEDVSTGVDPMALIEYMSALARGEQPPPPSPPSSPSTIALAAAPSAVGEAHASDAAPASEQSNDDDLMLDVGSHVGVEIDGEDFYGTIVEFNDDGGTVTIEEDGTGDLIEADQDSMFLENFHQSLAGEQQPPPPLAESSSPSPLVQPSPQIIQTPVVNPAVQPNPVTAPALSGVPTPVVSPAFQPNPVATPGLSGVPTPVVSPAFQPNPVASPASRGVPPPPMSPETAQMWQQRSTTSEDSTVLTTTRVDLDIVDDAHGFQSEDGELPAVMPLLLYSLIVLAVGGTLISAGAPNAEGLAFGLGMAVLVPATMLRHRVNEYLGVVSAGGWAVLLLSAWVGAIQATSGPGLLRIVTWYDGAVYSSLGLTVLSLGVASFAGVEQERLWSKRSANSLLGLSLAVLLFSATSEEGRESAGAILGTITGLWGVVVLGQTRDLQLNRPTDALAMLALFIGMMSLHAAWNYDIYSFLVVGLLICCGAIVAPYIPNEQQVSGLLLMSSSGLVGLSFFISELSVVNTAMHGVILVSLVVLLEVRYRGMTSKVRQVVQVHGPGQIQTELEQVMDSDIGILGFKGAGKTSFLGALWLMLDHHITRELWYNAKKTLEDTRPLPYSVTDLQELMLEAADDMDRYALQNSTDPKYILYEYIRYRCAAASMNFEFTTGKLPQPELGFPFIPQADRSTKRFLDNFSSKLAVRDRQKRRLPDATAGVSQDLILQLGYQARLRTQEEVYFGLKKQDKEGDYNVLTRIRCRDVPGEEVQRAVEYMAGKQIPQSSIQQLLTAIERRNEFGAQREAIRYVVEMTARFPHIIFMVDADELTSGDRDRDSPVKSFLLLADRLSKLSGSRVKHVTVLLNKADTLFARGGIPNRTMPNGHLRTWKDMLDRNLARETLVEVVGPAAFHSITLPIDVYFTCTFGGLIMKGGESDAAQEEIPTFPMVPVNVLEPVLRTLMNTHGGAGR